MEFQVEEFKMEEVFVGDTQTDEEHATKRKELLDKLNLPLQVKMFEEGGKIQYQRLSNAGLHIWGAFCPHKSDLVACKLYLPTRILEILETARTQFHKIEVWSEELATQDPILIGVLTNNYDSPKYLIARWGESLLPYAEVVQKARQKWISTRINKLKAKLKEHTLDLESVEADADKYLDGDSFVREIY